jgi:dihydrofolate reductase
LRVAADSDTLESADWQNTTLISGDAAAQIAELKQRDGKNIGMTGSGSLVRWLLRQGLLDELRWYVFPVVLGPGKRLFEREGPTAALSYRLRDLQQRRSPLDLRQGVTGRDHEPEVIHSNLGLVGRSVQCRGVRV